MRRNLHGTIATVQATLPAMAGADRPAVVTIGSVTGVKPNEAGTYAHYGVLRKRAAEVAEHDPKRAEQLLTDIGTEADVGTPSATWPPRSRSS